MLSGFNPSAELKVHGTEIWTGRLLKADIPGSVTWNALHEAMQQPEAWLACPVSPFSSGQ